MFPRIGPNVDHSQASLRPTKNNEELIIMTHKEVAGKEKSPRATSI